MNQSIQSMYKTTSSRPTSEDEKEVEPGDISEPAENKAGENHYLQSVAKLSRNVSEREIARDRIIN